NPVKEQSEARSGIRSTGLMLSGTLFQYAASHLLNGMRVHERLRIDGSHHCFEPPYFKPRNYRKHDVDRVAYVEASLKESAFALIQGNAFAHFVNQPLFDDVALRRDDVYGSIFFQSFNHKADAPRGGVIG